MTQVLPLDLDVIADTFGWVAQHQFAPIGADASALQLANVLSPTAWFAPYDVWEYAWLTQFRARFVQAYFTMPQHDRPMVDAIERGYARFRAACTDRAGGATLLATHDGDHRRFDPRVQLGAQTVLLGASSHHVKGRVVAALPRHTTRPARDLRHAALEAAIEADPYDAMARSVFVDWLIAQGDRRGTRMANGDRARLAIGIEHLLDNGDHFGGDPFTWRGGFIERAALRFDLAGVAAARVREVIEHPCGRFLVELGAIVPAMTDLAEVIAAIAGGPASLRVAELAVPPRAGEPIELDGAWVGLGHVHRLALRGRLVLGAIALAATREVALAIDGATRGTMDDLAGAAWPAVTRLNLGFGGGRWTADFIAPLPPLVHLGIRGLAGTDEAAGAIAAWPHRRALRSLALADTDLDARGADTLARAGVALDVLDVRRCKLLDEAALARLQPLARSVLAR